MKKLGLILAISLLSPLAHADLIQQTDADATKIKTIKLTLPEGIHSTKADGDANVPYYTDVRYELDLYEGDTKFFKSPFSNYNHCAFSLLIKPVAGKKVFDHFDKVILSDRNVLHFTFSKEVEEKRVEGSLVWKFVDATNLPDFQISEGTMTCFTSDEKRHDQKGLTVGDIKQQLTNSPNNLDGTHVKIKVLDEN